MLDVAACAEGLLDAHPLLRGLCRGRKQALLLLVCLHDLGKFSDSFRALLVAGTPRPYRHWKLSAVHLQAMDSQIARSLGGDPEARRILGAAVAGHHGGPPNSNELAAKRRCIGEGAKAAARAFVAAVAGLFPGATLEGISADDGRTISWLVSGLSVQSDWLGSNIRWFPVDRQHATIDEAWADSRVRARQTTRAPALRSPRRALLPVPKRFWGRPPCVRCRPRLKHCPCPMTR